MCRQSTVSVYLFVVCSAEIDIEMNFLTERIGPLWLRVCRGCYFGWLYFVEQTLASSSEKFFKFSIGTKPDKTNDKE